MKKNSLNYLFIAVFIGLSTNLFSEKIDEKKSMYPMSRFSTQKKDYAMSNFHFFNLIATSKSKYSPDIGDKLTNVGGGISGRWDWVLPQDGMYAYTDGTNLFAAFTEIMPSGGFFEGGMGWMFNKSNEKALESSDFFRAQWGLGLGFGFRAINLRAGNSRGYATMYGALWPEVASIMNLGDRITLHPKFILTPMLNNGFFGLRTGSEFLVDVRLTGFLGISARFASETMRFNDEVQAYNGGSYTGKAKFKSMQIGLSFHQSTGTIQKASRD